MFPNVTVLLSTYNGEKYLSQQLESIFNQKNVCVRLIVRDDGSKDGTIEILEEYARKYDNLVIIRGENVGPRNSFFKLLEYANSDIQKTNYYAFSDQDDFWLDEKLSKAISLIKEYELPTLYCSNLYVTDESLNIVGKMYHGNELNITKESSLLLSIATGCSIVFNNSMLNLTLSLPFPNKIMMHDWWLFLLANFFGKFIYDSNAYIYYRQHSNNVLGARRMNIFHLLYNFIHSIFNSSSNHYRRDAAVEFLSICDDKLPNSDKAIIEKVAFYDRGINNRIKLAFNNKYVCSNYRLFFRILFNLV